MYSVRRYKYNYFTAIKNAKKVTTTKKTRLCLNCNAEVNVYETLYKYHFTHKHQPVQHNVLNTSIKYRKTEKHVCETMYVK